MDEMSMGFVGHEAADASHGGKTRYILLLHHFVIVFIVLSAYLFILLNIEADRAAFITCLILVCVFAWCCWSWHRTNRSFFDPYILFITSAFLFNGGLALLYLFGIGFDDTIGASFSSETLLKSLFLVITSIAALNYGALICSNRARPTGLAKESRNQGLIDEALRNVGWLLICISIIPFALVINESVSIVNRLGYFGLFQREAATGFGGWSNVMAAFLIPGILFLLIGSRDRRLGRRASLFLMCGYSVAYVFIGSRNKALLPVVAFLWLWHKYISPLNKKNILIIILVILIMMFVLFPLVKVVRNVPGAFRTSFSFYFANIKGVKNPLVDPLAEMGGSLRTVTYTVGFIPQERGYDYGASYLYALFTIVPNFAWRVHPTIERGTLSDWLVEKVDPATAAAGGGYGFSFIAEAYANFSWFGTIIIMIFLGYFIAALTLRSQKTENTATAALLASILPQLLFFARGESALLVRSIVWYALMPYLLAVLIYKAKEGAKERSVALGQISGVREITLD